MQVMILVPCLGYGGAERQIALIAPKLKARGYQVVVVSMIEPTAYVERLKEANVPVLCLGMKRGTYSFSGFLHLRKILRQNEFRYIITFNYPANFAGRILKILNPRVRLITSIRSSTFGAKWRHLFIKITKYLDFKTVPNSLRVAKAFQEKGIIASKRTTVIHNGIDTKSYDSTLSSKINIRHNYPCDFLWLAVGRHEEAKDYPTLIEACKQLQTTAKIDWKLIVVGSGRLTDRISELIQSYELEEHVKLVGQVPFPIAYYQACDAYVLSSAWEGMPNALIEAMASGKPCIATDVGEVSEIIEDEISGFIVPPKNALEIAMKMLHVMTLPKLLRNRIGENAKNTTQNKFDVENIVREWETLLS